jgi:hypothetical protein
MLAVTALLLALPGCNDLTSPETLGQFTWSEIEGAPVEESSNIVAIGRDVLVIGELTTPTACYRLFPHLSEGGSRMTLRIEGRNTQTPNCAQRTGSYRYQATLNQLESSTRELVIVHDIEDGERTEFTHPLDIGG